MHIAVQTQNEALLQYLVSEPGVNLNKKDALGQTVRGTRVWGRGADASAQPLYIAVSSGFKSMALLLAEHGADIEGEEEVQAAAPRESAAGLDDEIDAAFQDLGLDMGDLDGLMDGGGRGGGGGGAPAERAWEDEMAEMDRFLDEAGAGAVPTSRVSTSAAMAAARDDHAADASLQVTREKPALVQTQFVDTGSADVRSSAVAGLDDVDNLLGQIKQDESAQLAESTKFIVNQDAITNCVVDFISIYAKTAVGPLPAEDVAEFVSLAEFLREEIMVNYDKFALWLETLPNENLVSLHANRNQLKQSSAALLEVVKRYGSEARRADMTKELQTRVQTMVGDCWSFYVNTNDPWKYDHVVFYVRQRRRWRFCTRSLFFADSFAPSKSRS